MKLRILTEEEVAASAAQWEAGEKLESERRRLRDACVAKHGDHDWELELEHPDADEDEGGGVDLHCTRCPVGIDDVFPDGQYMIYLGINGVDDAVREGRHYLPIPLIVPVSVKFQNLSHWNMDYGYEHDAELIIEQRGPVRRLGEQMTKEDLILLVERAVIDESRHYPGESEYEDRCTDDEDACMDAYLHQAATINGVVVSVYASPRRFAEVAVEALKEFLKDGSV